MTKRYRELKVEGVLKHWRRLQEEVWALEQDAANIAFNLTRAMTDGVVLGPILMGSAKPAHVLTSAATVRRVFNMTALACVEAQIRGQAIVQEKLVLPTS
jgi:hypothetical protein